MYFQRINIKHILVITLFTTLMISCDKDDDGEMMTQVNYPSGINDLTKLLKQKIDFAATINPDTITYQYNSNRLVTSVNSTRDRYLINYQYGSDNALLSSQKTDLINNSVVSETQYTYNSNEELTTVTKESGITIDSTLWNLDGLKGLEANAYIKSGSRIFQIKKIYTWSGENLEKQEIYEKIDIETSFNNFVSFPGSLDKTIENIVSFYNLELLENSSDYFLTRRTKFESYNEAINVLRYLSNVVPVTESQKIYEIQQTNLYDEERRTYFKNTGYTTFTADNEGYPLRLATGGSGARKLDFIYE
jgi:hypothetical protein